MTDTKKNIFLFLLFSSVALFAIFPRLGSLPLREWDESRQAASAYEMYESGNYLVATFDHKPDLWNTKPPLLLWLQVLSMKIWKDDENHTFVQVTTVDKIIAVCGIILVVIALLF